MKQSKFPPGWDAARVGKVLRHYQSQSDAEALAEDEAAFEESENQKNLWRKSSADWKALYESEKARADGIQESRITELKGANDELAKANFFYKQQAADDKQRLGEQEFKIRKLKSERKYYFATGFGLGFGTGTYAGYQRQFL